MALQFLHSPIRFTDRMLERPVDLRWPAAIFFGFIFSRTLGNYLFFSRMVGQLPPHLSEGIDLMALGFVFSLIALAISDIVFWFVGTGVLTCLNILLDGDGEYRKILELTGFAHLPLLFFGLSVLLFGSLYQPDLDFSPYAGLDLAVLQETDREQHQQAVQGIEGILVNEAKSAPFQVFFSLNLLCYLYLVFLIAAANSRVFRLPMGKSVLAVLGIVALYIGISLTRYALFPTI
jgi:hypothetical protein